MPTYPRLRLIIKLISGIVITGVLGLVLGNLNGLIAPNSWLETLFWLGSMALLWHLVAAIAATVIADRANLNPLKAGIYTFWMGVAGISELRLQVQERDRTRSQP